MRNFQVFFKTRKIVSLIRVVTKSSKLTVPSTTNQRTCKNKIGRTIKLSGPKYK